MPNAKNPWNHAERPLQINFTDVWKDVLCVEMTRLGELDIKNRRIHHVITKNQLEKLNLFIKKIKTLIYKF